MNGLISKAIERGEEDEARMLAKWFKNTFEDDFYMEIAPSDKLVDAVMAICIAAMSTSTIDKFSTKKDAE